MPLESHRAPPSPPSSPPPDASAPASQSRLPDYHVLGSLTDIKPGTIPLLLRMPDGNCEQLDVPLHSTVDDIASSLQKHSGDSFRLSFGNSDLDPTASLVDTNIVDAYEHAGSLLHLIASGKQDADTKAAALDSACAVVQTISNGVKDMEALCAAAMQQDQLDQPEISQQNLQHQNLQQQHLQQPHLPQQHLEQQHIPQPHSNSSDENREDPPHIDRPEFKVFQTSSGTTPSELAYHLSRRMPNLFPLSGTAPAFPSEQSDPSPEQPQLGRRATRQPSLSSIRDARRRACALRKAQQNQPSPNQTQPAREIPIGESTNVPVPLDLHQSPHTQQRDSSSLMLANSGKTTWLEDVMKTWEVDTVRDSGILEKSKDGQEISNYLQSLEDEVEREVQVEQNDNGLQTASSPTASGPGDSSDDEEDDEQQGNTTQPTHPLPCTVPNGQQHSPLNGHTNTSPANPAKDLHKSMAAVNISDRNRTDPATQMLRAQNAASVAVMEGATTPEQHHSQSHSPSLPSNQQLTHNPNPQRSSHPSQSAQQPPQPSHQTPPSHPALQIPKQPTNISLTNSPTSSQTPSSNTGRISENLAVSARDIKGKPPTRQATKIAPAPNLSNSPLTGANGIFANPMYPGVVPLPGVPWPTQTAVPGPKKRGRKRKYPELTEEERALVRKEQNRESAKLSRVRRKVIAAEYEGRLTALIDENSMLRKQVEGLNNRLVFLQSLLTVSVRQEPPP